MAIAVDTTTDGSNTTGTSLTYSHTCTGSNLILFVGVQADPSSDLISGVTYNSVAMTLVDKNQRGGSSRWTYLFYLIAPATGAHNVVVSASSSSYIESGAVSYTGAKQSGQPDATNKSSGTATNLALATTTVADNAWVLEWIVTTGASMTAGSNTTLRLSINGGVRNSDFYDTNGAVTPAGSRTLNVNFASNGYAAITASIAPAVSATNGSFLLNFI